MEIASRPEDFAALDEYDQTSAKLSSSSKNLVMRGCEMAPVKYSDQDQTEGEDLDMLDTQENVNYDQVFEEMLPQRANLGPQSDLGDVVKNLGE